MSKEIVNLNIDSLTHEGDGIGSLHGLKVFVPNALVGEVIECEIVEKKANYAKANLLRLISTSSRRQKPLCPLFGCCGGCQIMHLDYSEQLKTKENRVKENIKRIGGLSDQLVAPCIPSAPLFYRHKIQLPVRYENGVAHFGLYRRQSHEMVDIERCFIQCERTDSLLQLLKETLKRVGSLKFITLRQSWAYEQSLLILTTDGTNSKTLQKIACDLQQQCPTLEGVVENINPHARNTIFGPHFKTLAGQPYYFDEILSLRFRISAASFFQVNPPIASKLIAQALTWAAIAPTDHILDAYAGVGVLALHAAQSAACTVGIESAPSSVRDALYNATMHKAQHVEFFAALAENKMAQLGRFDTIFLNPPRKGCDKVMIEALLKKSADKIIYISCDPATLARDLKLLAPLYEVQGIYPYDMFPQTMHVETLALLKRF